MEIPQEIDDYIKHSIDLTLGLEVPNQALLLKLQSLEASNYSLRHQYLALQSKLKEKDDAVERARAEACMNAQALKRFVVENQKLASECANLVSQCTRLEGECSLYDHDREALMEFGNEAHEKAKDAENRVLELEEELNRVSEEAQLYKHQYEKGSASSSMEEGTSQQNLVDALISSLVNGGGDNADNKALAFLQANRESETCESLLKMWKSLRPGTRNIISLVARLQALQKGEENLKVNLFKAEEEVNVLCEENTALRKENKKLLRHCNPEWKHCCSSGGKHSGGSTAKKSNKRKSSPNAASSPIIERKLDLANEVVVGSPRQPLSPLKENSPEFRTPKK